MQNNGSKSAIFHTFLADPEKMMKKYFLNVYEKVFVEKLQCDELLVWYGEISGVDFV